METPLYLDHAATTPPLPVALEAFQQALEQAYANPGSLHQAGADAARSLEKSRKALQKAFGARSYRVIWTATGTEGNHLGILGAARAKKTAWRGQPRALVGAIEHPSSLAAAESLAAEGFAVETLPVDGGGLVTPEALTTRLGDDVALVSLQWANNEIGGVNAIAELVALTRNLAPKAHFHCDAVQAVGKLAAPLDGLGADSFAVAAHKLGGIRGCAAFLLKEGTPEPAPLFLGGGHEGGLRSGTENVMGAAAFSTAALERRRMIDADPNFLHRCRAHLLQGLRSLQPDLQVLGPEEEASQLGAVLALALPGIVAEPFLHRLEAQGVLVGSGSACHAHGATESAVLQAIDLAPELRNSVLRLSFSGLESDAELDRVVEVFRAVMA